MIKDLTSWLMENYGQEQLKPDPGLARIKAALAHLLPDLKKTRIVTIAGTNGKGETTLWLSSYLKKNKHCVWISPHIERITERFRDENGEIDYVYLCQLIDECHQRVQAQGLKLSYYEFLFMVFCHWANLKKPEVLLLEVGLGGRMDAVNAFDADLVLLPSISRDHQEFLGSRYDLILKEKLGLLRKGSRLISYLSLQYLRERTAEYNHLVQAEWIDLSSLKLHQNYEFSARNQLLAYAAFLSLEGKNLQEIAGGRFFKNWTANSKSLEHRGEVIESGASYAFFGSHNVDGMRKLIQFLHSGNYNFHRPPYKAVIVAFSKRDEQDLRVLLRMLKSSGLGSILVTTFAHAKAAPVEQIEKLAIQEGLSFVDDIESYTKDENFGGKGSLVLVTGSYYFLGHFKSILTGR